MTEWGQRPCLVQGDTWDPELVYQNPDGTPVDLTGFTAKLQMRVDPEATAVLDLSSEPSGGLTIYPSEGRIQIVATSSMTSDIPPELTYQWELEVYKASTDYRRTFPRQELDVKAQITV